jgi:hypothetical protein
MNFTRIAILAVAAIAAGAAALLVRGMLGGGTPPVQASLPPPAATLDILVAAKDIPPGRALDTASVRWESWPKNSVSNIFITRQAQPDINKAVAGVVVRSPLTTGQPITEASIVRAGATGFLAATITPGMRAVSIPISAATGAGGLILPNDRVDVVLTRDIYRAEAAPRISSPIRCCATCACSPSTRPRSSRRTSSRKWARRRLWNCSPIRRNSSPSLELRAPCHLPCARSATAATARTKPVRAPGRAPGRLSSSATA